MMFAVLGCALVTAFRLHMPSGASVSLHGTGPPVVFSSGLFNTMPSWLYRQLFATMTKNVTLVVPTGPVTADAIGDIADALRVDHVGLFAHSSFLANALASPRLQAAVLCDPITLPEVGVAGLQPTSIRAQCPVLSLRASRAYDDATVPIPPLNTPAIAGEGCATATVDAAGHPDILDDVWADLAARTGLWQTIRSQPTLSFREWYSVAPPIDPVEVKESRARYRADVAERALRFLLRPDGGA